MLQEIEKLINQSKLKSLSSTKLEEQLEQLLGGDYSGRGGYVKFERILQQLCAQGVLEPVKVSGTNGRNPLLYNRYRKVSSGKKRLKPLKERLTLRAQKR